MYFYMTKLAFLSFIMKSLAVELISEEEWGNMHTIRIEDRFNYWYAEDKRFKIRFSEQTWLHWENDETGILMNIRERSAKLYISTTHVTSIFP